MDLDYRALSNAGLWFVGRLQTDADRERVVEGLAGLEGGGGVDAADLGAKLKTLSPRWFVMRDVYWNPAVVIAQTRWTFTWMRGPMTRVEIRRARGVVRPLPLPLPLPNPNPGPNVTEDTEQNSGTGTGTGTGTTTGATGGEKEAAS